MSVYPVYDPVPLLAGHPLKVFFFIFILNVDHLMLDFYLASYQYCFRVNIYHVSKPKSDNPMVVRNRARFGKSG